VVEPPGPHDPDGIVITALLAACPSFGERWRNHVRSPNGGIGPYIDLSAFAEHIVGLLEAKQTGEFPDVFDAVERLLIDGDEGIRYLVAYGLFESLQNVSSNRHHWVFSGQFRAWLGPTSMRAWNEVHRLWGTSDALG
jgi:hypothetical protein